VLFPEYWQVNTLVLGLHCRIFPSHATYPAMRSRNLQ
jgi:ribosomal protein S6--L-glutamate ligase